MSRPRDPYLDVLRTGSLLVVVCWHWLGSTITWADNGPHATSLLARVPGLWLLTWLLQVMPVFFHVGGHLHLRGQHPDGRYRPGFVTRRVRHLAGATAPLLAGWALAGAVLAYAGGPEWAGGVVLFALAPLWFLGVYLMLVLLLPAMLWLHRRLGPGAPILMALAAVTVDVARFRFDLPGAGWANLVLVWAFAHQTGFHHDRLVRLPRRTALLPVGAGLTVLCVLLWLGYPGSMVGVPGDRWSNMSPPTCAIVALTVLQLGLVALARPVVAAVASGRHATRVLAAANRYAMPVFLFHQSVLLLAQAVGWPLVALLAAVAGTTRRRRGATAPGRP